MGENMAKSCWLLLTLSLTGTLAGDWSVDLPSGPICAVTGSSVVLPCSYDYPRSSNETRREGQDSVQDGADEEEYRVVSEMWCLEDSRCLTPKYVFHSDHIFPDPSYQDRAEYLGEHGNKDCSLRISNLTMSDSGTYVFYLITNHSAEKMPEQKGIQLLVTDSSNATTVLASPSGVISEGQPLRLACCSPAAGPETSFRWHRGISMTHSGQVWNITGVTTSHSGSYYCEVQTGDQVQNSPQLTIDVQYTPRNVSISVSPPGELHDTLPVTLTCSSDANPPISTYMWYQGAACLPTEDKSFYQGKRTVAIEAEGGLSSASITVEEYGQHCCVARNRHGSQTSSVMLRRYKASVTPSASAAGKAVLIGVTVGLLLTIIAIAAILIKRRRTLYRQQSYILAATTSREL